MTWKKWRIPVSIMIIILLVLISFYFLLETSEKSIYITDIDYNKNPALNENINLSITIKRRELKPGEGGTDDVWYPRVNVTISGPTGISFNEIKIGDLEAWGSTDTLYFNFKLNETGTYKGIITVSGKWTEGDKEVHDQREIKIVVK